MTDEAYEERRGHVDVLARADIIHLKELNHVNDRRYEQRFVAQETALLAALTAQAQSQKQVADSLKEATLKSEAKADERFSAMTGQLAKLQELVNLSLGKGAGAVAMWGYIVGVVGVLATVVSIYALLKP